MHRLNDRGMQNARTIALAFDDCLAVLEGVCPSPSRELALVRTKLEEACFYAKKAMALDATNCIDEERDTRIVTPAELPKL